MKKLLILFLLMSLFFISGCKVLQEELGVYEVETEEEATPEDKEKEPTDIPTQEPEPTEEVVPTEIPAEDEEEEDEETVEVVAEPTPLPVLPLDITFTAEDGTELMGDFFPPASQNAPVVVLMHQYPMDHNVEWIAIAPWIQNRGLTEAVRPSNEFWADPSWFPPMIEGADFGVFSFTFRNCIGGCNVDSVVSREEWIMDAVSAIKAAASFTSIDPQKVIVLGTSIGADAGVNACVRLLDNDSVSCIGVISLSPGSYLDEDYGEGVAQLDEAGVPVRCVASENDGHCPDTCLAYEGENYESFIVTGGEHGIRLFDPASELDVPGLVAGSLIEWAYVK